MERELGALVGRLTNGVTELARSMLARLETHFSVLWWVAIRLGCWL